MNTQVNDLPVSLHAYILPKIFGNDLPVSLHAYSWSKIFVNDLPVSLHEYSWSKIFVNDLPVSLHEYILPKIFVNGLPVSLHEYSWSKIFVWVPPVTWARGRTTSAKNTLVQTILQNNHPASNSLYNINKSTFLYILNKQEHWTEINSIWYFLSAIF